MELTQFSSLHSLVSLNLLQTARILFLSLAITIPSLKDTNIYLFLETFPTINIIMSTYLIIQAYLYDVQLLMTGTEEAIAGTKKIMFIVVCIYMILVYGDYSIILALSSPKDDGSKV